MRQLTTRSDSSQPNTHHYLDEDSNIRLFIKQRYRDTFNARIQVTYPHLIALQDTDNNTLSAIGYRDGHAPFFVEHYIDWPIQDTLSQILGHNVNRSEIAELGNLAAMSKRHTIALLQQTWSILLSMGYSYVVFCGTQSILRLFRSLPYRIIATADPVAVPARDDWGTYYSHRPAVICAKLEDYDQRFGFSTNGSAVCIRHLRNAEI